ncbi:sigma 54-interacting transcriptional regulator [Desulfopila aestuarii]|uniref:PAS domain S-box-containing protein n=1 Tax=Desulfopila aestuarii DSM 18488 TaxID=1121416 RepID=A0A1M7Y059_9BACT|nr:sigma 54-interacting transcriptional regulator [Desulfopila aestuarii]SHO44682.1 PAS domain S-box-containing protein [Desulfopila aestuarii DSM 18488]
MTVRPDPYNNPFFGGYITADINWRITSCNRTAAKILQHSEHFLIGKDCREIFCANDSFHVLCTHLKAIAGKYCSTSVQHTLPTLTTSDTNIPITVQLVTLPAADGSILGTLISFSELTTPLAANRLALNSIAEGVFTVDHNCKITSFNVAAEKITGWQEAEVLGRPCRDIFRTPICKTDCAMAQSIKDGTQVIKRSLYITTRQGKAIPVQICAAPLVDLDNNVIGGVETFRDITDSLQNDIVLNAVADGVFTVNEKGEITSFNRAAEKITGWKEKEVLGKSCAEVLLSSTNTTSCTLAACMRERTAIIDREIFIIGKDGYSIPVSVSAAPFLDPNGNVLGGVESFRDNTNRLQTQLILDSVADGVFTVDRNWRITSFNLAAERITGWSREKAVGQFCSDVFHSSICGKNCAIAESLYTGKPVASRTITIQDLRDNCTSVSISAAPLLDLEGNVVGGVETFRDLSVEISLRQQLMKNFTFDAIISKSPSMQRLFQILPDISRSESNVLILGESGTGKELIARAIFNASARNDKPFVIVNCGALPETLLESELFGYKAGAFTDAKKDRQGRFAAAEGGTLFLDEIGDIPQSVQVKLLRVLQHKVYEPLGSNTPLTANVRILAATNRELSQLVQEGQFRDDLFYRLNVVNILLPPLRERIEDIPLLITHFVEKFRAEKQKDIVGVSDEVMNILMHHNYPGNIRELENIIEYGFILCPGGYIQLAHLPESVAERQLPTGQTVTGVEGMPLAELEKQAILISLERNDWKRMKTCRELGISKDTLRRKLHSYGFDDDGLKQNV